MQTKFLARRPAAENEDVAEDSELFRAASAHRRSSTAHGHAWRSTTTQLH